MIPEMTNRLGRHWKQPADIRTAPMDDTHVILTPRQVEQLANYQCSTPSGVYEGKCWRRNDQLCWYRLHDTPGFHFIEVRDILIQEE